MKYEILSIIYILCVAYCVWRTSARYAKSSHDGVTGYTPGLDLLAILALAPILAPIDLIVTGIKAGIKACKKKV